MYPKISGLMNCECAEALCQALSSRVDFTPGPEAGCGPSSSREELLLLSKLVFVHVHFERFNLKEMTLAALERF